jgi:hypothetical protein
VRKSSPLSNWALVVNLPDSMNQPITEWNLAKNDAFLLRLLCLVAGLETNLLCPPIFKRGYGNRSKIIHFHWICKVRLGIGQFLQESEQVNPHSRPSKTFHNAIWFLFQKLKLLCIEAGHSQKSTRNFDFRVAHSHNTSALILNLA